MPKRTSRELSVEELKEIAERIIAGKTSIRSAAEEDGVSRNTLRRDLEKIKEKYPEIYEALKEKNEKNQKSGGKISGNKSKVYGNPEEIKRFYIEEYLRCKGKGETNDDTIEKTNVSRATFYRKQEAFKIFFEEGKIEFSKEEIEVLKNNFMILPDFLKEWFLIQKFKDREKTLNIRPRREDIYIKELKAFIQFIEERNDNCENKIDRQSIYHSLNKNIDLLRISLERKFKPSIEFLDREISAETTNIIIAKKPFIFSFSLKRIEELIDIANSFDSLNKFANSPDRSSPKLLYALLKYAKENEVHYKTIEQIGTQARLNGLGKEDLLNKYPYTSNRKSLDVDGKKQGVSYGE